MSQNQIPRKPQIERKTGAGPDGADLLQLRFMNDEQTLLMLNAAELAECLQGLTELTGIMARQGSFDSVTAPELMVRPLKEGSFLVEVQLLVQEPAIVAGAISGGTWAVVRQAPVLVETIGAFLKLARTRVERAEPAAAEGHTQIFWQDGSMDEVSDEVWRELQNQKVSSKRALRKILAPLAGKSETLEMRVGQTEQTSEEIEESEPEAIIDVADYKNVVAFPDEIEETFSIFDAEGQLITVDFNRSDKWKIKAEGETRTAIIEDRAFLRAVDTGLALRKDDIFSFKIREDRERKNGRTTRTWTIINVNAHKRGANDESQDEE